eukprot:gene17434-20032_t
MATAYGCKRVVTMYRDSTKDALRLVTPTNRVEDSVDDRYHLDRSSAIAENIKTYAPRESRSLDLSVSTTLVRAAVGLANRSSTWSNLNTHSLDYLPTKCSGNNCCGLGRVTGLWQERHGVDIPNSRVTMQLFHEDYVIIISIVGSALTAAHLFYSIKIAIRRQELAYAGDAAAAKRIILPCYKPLVRGILLFYLLFSVALSLTFVNPDLDVHRLVQYYAFSLLTVYSITPVMLVQTSVSAAAFWRTFYTILPYWALNTLVFGLVDVGGTTARICRILFIISATLPPLILS